MQTNLNLNVRGLKPSSTLAINERSNQLSAEGRKVYKFGLGQSPFPVPKHIVKALQDHAHEKDYLPVKGLMALRESIANFHNRRYALNVDPSQVVIGPGSKELIFILQLVFYGDLIIPTPSWVSYSPQAQIIGRKVHWVTTREEDDWRISPGQLEELCKEDPDKPRILILNYPSNPTGKSYSLMELKELADVARKYQVVLISDEIYGLIHHEGKHESIAEFYPEGTIISSGLSKWCGAGGWRLGYFIMPKDLPWLNDAMAIVASETFTATAAPIQYAAITAFEDNPEIDDYLDRSRRILKRLALELGEILSSTEVSYPKPDGGFYLFLNFEAYRSKLAKKNIYNSRDFCELLLNQTGIALLPGMDFGCPASMLVARLAYVNFDGTSAIEGAVDKEVNTSFILKHCWETIEGTQQLAKWLARL